MTARDSRTAYGARRNCARECVRRGTGLQPVVVALSNQKLVLARTKVLVLSCRQHGLQTRATKRELPKQALTSAGWILFVCSRITHIYLFRLAPFLHRWGFHRSTE